MTATSSSSTARSHDAVDAVVERLNDPAVAASLVTLLDNAELLSTLVIGLGAFIERSETIVDAVTESVNELKAAGAVARPADLPSVADLAVAASQLAAAGPVLERVLASPMVESRTIDLLSMLSEAADDGAAAAVTNRTTVKGVRGIVGAIRDDDVQRGLGFLVEIARALGKRLDRPSG